MSNRTATRPRVLRPNDHRLGWQDRERAQSVRQGYEKLGYEFFAHEGGIDILRFGGGQWHTVNGRGCDCRAAHFGRMCSHQQAVNECGGVKALREALERWP